MQFLTVVNFISKTITIIVLLSIVILGAWGHYGEIYKCFHLEACADDTQRKALYGLIAIFISTSIPTITLIVYLLTKMHSNTEELSVHPRTS